MARRLVTKRFQQTLVSNAFTKIFKNSPDNFTNALLHPTELLTPYEVAIVDISYPLRWDNVNRNCNVAYLARPANPAIALTDTKTFEGSTKAERQNEGDDFDKKVTSFLKENVATSYVYRRSIIPAGSYESVSELALYIAQDIEKRFANCTQVRPKVEINYDTIRERLEFKVAQQQSEYRVFLITDSPYLLDLLGFVVSSIWKDYVIDFEQDNYTIKNELYCISMNRTANRPPLLDAVQVIFIYSDICEYQQIGNVMAPLLGIVSVGEGKRNRQQYFAFPDLSYVACSKSYLDKINIQLYDAYGERMNIKSGVVIVRLDFRQKKENEDAGLKR